MNNGTDQTERDESKPAARAGRNRRLPVVLISVGIATVMAFLVGNDVFQEEVAACADSGVVCLPGFGALITGSIVWVVTLSFSWLVLSVVEDLAG